jgi:hypothetical protein
VQLAYQNPTSRGGRLRDRASFDIALENPLGAVDRALHGRDGLRGWGTSAQPDPVLYRVQGFDPASHTFKYAVNPQFGRSHREQAHAASPFGITLRVGIRMGAPVEQQQLRLYLRPGRGIPGTRATAESLQRRYARNVPDVYARILVMGDSLVLTAAQTEGLREAQIPYRARLDAVWRELGTYMASLPEQYNMHEAVQQQEEATDRAWEINRGEASTIRDLLSPFQIQMLEPLVREALFGNSRRQLRIWRQ